MELFNPIKGMQKENIFQKVLSRAAGKQGVISLAIGDNPGPIHDTILQQLMAEVLQLSTASSHKGYPPEEGLNELKTLINDFFYQGQFSLDEIFISDGIKTDLFRIQTLLGSKVKASYFSPGYPAYHDGCYIAGADLDPVPLLYEEDFYPNIDRVKRFDVFYLCSPNNPTGVALSGHAMDQLIMKAKKFNGLIVHDACYSPYIQDLSKPKNVFIHEESKSFCLELGSFSKWAAFSGLRLSWAVIPKQILFKDQTRFVDAYTTLINATYNGVSWLSQSAGISILKKPTIFLNQVRQTMQRVAVLQQAFETAGYKTFGGKDCPYIVVQSSDDFLEKYNILTLPLEAFDSKYKGFSRVSGFVSEKNLKIATSRLQNCLKNL
jgi:LL-diaminopimelate aminotransferase